MPGKRKKFSRQDNEENLDEATMEATFREFGFEGLFDVHSDRFNAERAYQEDVVQELKPILVGAAGQEILEAPVQMQNTDKGLHQLPDFLKPPPPSAFVATTNQDNAEQVEKILTQEMNKLSEQHIQKVCEVFASFPAQIPGPLLRFLELCDEQQNTIPTLSVFLYGLKLQLSQPDYYVLLKEICSYYNTSNCSQIPVLLAYLCHFGGFNVQALFQLVESRMNVQLLLRILRISGGQMGEFAEIKQFLAKFQSEMENETDAVLKQVKSVQIHIARDLVAENRKTQNVFQQSFLQVLDQKAVELRQSSVKPDYPVQITLQELLTQNTKQQLSSSNVTQQQMDLAQRLQIHQGGEEFKLMLVLANPQPGFPHLSESVALQQLRSHSGFYNKCVQLVASWLVTIVEVADELDYYYVNCFKILATTLPRNANFVGSAFSSYMENVETKNSRSVGNVARVLAHMLGQKVECGRINPAILNEYKFSGKKAQVFLDILVLTLLSGQVANSNFQQGPNYQAVQEVFELNIQQIRKQFLNRMSEPNYSTKICKVVGVQEVVVGRIKQL